MEAMVQLDRGETERSLIAWLSALGLPEQVATGVVQHVVQAELVGRRSHGLRLLPWITQNVRTRTDGSDEVTSELLEPGTRRVDARSLPGIYAVGRGIDLALDDHAAGRGVVVTGIVEFTGTTGCLGLYAHRLADAGITGLVLATSRAIVAAPGTSRPVLGTNAVSFGAPVAGGAPIVGDFSSSAMTYGEVALARARGETVPAGVLVDASGRPTTDPGDVVEGSLLPSGGHKGWTLALLVELLAGALTGGKVGRGAGRESALVLSFRADAFGTGGAAAAAGDLVRQILEVGDGGEPSAAHIPGARFTTLQESPRHLDVDSTVVERIEAIGGPRLA
jgi:LDH2 family malate/lactate/ureidoglycolate dehydrogenase